MWLDSTAQRRYVIDGITEMACFLRKNRDLSIENSLRLIDCTLDPLLAFSGPVIIWPEKEFKKLTAAFVRRKQGGLADVTKHVNSSFHLPERPGGSSDKNA